MARKEAEVVKQEEVKCDTFTKAQILASNRYANRRDAFAAILPDDWEGTCKEAEDLLDNFMKGQVK